MKRVVFCGKISLSDDMLRWAEPLEAAGIEAVIPDPDFTLEEWNQLPPEQQLLRRKGWAEKHHALIDTADAVFVYNPKGYAGYSMTLEIGYALGKGKPVYAMEHDAELGRGTLYRGYCATAKQLIKILMT